MPRPIGSMISLAKRASSIDNRSVLIFGISPDIHVLGPFRTATRYPALSQLLPGQQRMAAHRWACSSWFGIVGGVDMGKAEELMVAVDRQEFTQPCCYFAS